MSFLDAIKKIESKIDPQQPMFALKPNTSLGTLFM
jgi:hypothetical protein